MWCSGQVRQAWILVISVTFGLLLPQSAWAQQSSESERLQANLSNSKNSKSKKRLRKRIQRKKRQRLRRLQVKKELKDASSEDSPSFSSFASVGLGVYLFETESNNTPDFDVSEASLGVSGEHRAFSGAVEAGLREDGEKVQVSQSYLAITAVTQTVLTGGRFIPPGASGYGAYFSAWPTDVGAVDGASLGQTLTLTDSVSLKLGGGIANAFSSDATYGYSARSHSLDRAYFGWSQLTLGVLQIRGLFGLQNNQTKAIDDEETEDFNEESIQDYQVASASAGLHFDSLAIGAHVTAITKGDESYLEEAQVSPEGESLAFASMKMTYGGGLTLNVAKSLIYPEDSVSLQGGYDLTQLDSEGVTNDETMAASANYGFGGFGLGLHYAFQRSSDMVKFKDASTGNDTPHAQTAMLSLSYKFSHTSTD